MSTSNNNKVLIKFESFCKNEDSNKSNLRFIYKNGNEDTIKLNELKEVEIEIENENNNNQSLSLVGYLNFQVWTSKIWGINGSFGFISNGGNRKSVVKTINSLLILDCVEVGHNQFKIQLLDKTINLNKNENKIWISLFSKSYYDNGYDHNYQLKLKLRNTNGGGSSKSFLINCENTKEIHLPVLKSNNNNINNNKNFDFYSAYKAIYDIEFIGNNKVITNGSITLEINNNLSNNYNKIYNLLHSSFEPFNGNIEIVDQANKHQQLIFNFKHSSIGSATQ